jgi:cell division protein FtsL
LFIRVASTIHQSSFIEIGTLTTVNDLSTFPHPASYSGTTDKRTTTTTTIMMVGVSNNGGTAVGESGGGRTRCCWILLHFWNTFAVAILAVAVVFLFIQLQYVNYTLKLEQDRINDLLQQVKDQQSNQIQQLSQQVQQEHSLTVYQMAGTFTLLVALITIFHMSSHLRSYYQPMVQRRILAILWMSPIYSLTSFFSLVFPKADGYLSVIRDFYEAYIIYTFLAFLIAVLGKGDRGEAVRVLSLRADHLHAAARCFRALYQPLADPQQPQDVLAMQKAHAVMTECQVLALQFVFIRPLTSILNFVTSQMEEGRERTGEPSPLEYFQSIHFALDILTNMSVFLAFTGLLKFYHAVQEDLAWCQPFSKFMAIKGIVFLTFWQGLLITILVHLKWSDKDQGSVLNLNSVTHTDTVVDSVTNNATRWLDMVSKNHTYADYSNHVNATTSTASASTAGSDYYSTKTPQEQASEIQNFLICLEMLFFSIAHWCVFPSEEWEANYRPRRFVSPGMGLKDFASDVGYLTSSISRARNLRKRQQLATTDDASDGDVFTLDTKYSDEESVSISPKTQSAPDTVDEDDDVELDSMHRATLT